ncbi:glutamate racemase [Thermocoleostomius sinensis A174]|jgi:glutamate racemase|uniref:Glutamate racemase n=2 Tax=Thermocoleostomius TaxID=3065395 RepID=A0A9E8Z9F0_9CYAN|nr:glutamate racemase [Thermocoleostomius sinensis A174]
MQIPVSNHSSPESPQSMSLSQVVEPTVVPGGMNHARHNANVQFPIVASTERQRARIGIFDSGVGGLTVLREVYRQLPNESILYFGDTARLPYGIRSQAEILQFVREILNWMLQQGVKMVIMACHTGSALALETVRSEFPIPILGVILPGARAAVQQGKRIGVIATPATAKSNAFRQAILEINPAVNVWQVGCPEFVPLVENNRIHDPYTYRVAKEYLQPLLEQQIDTLIYGCTHYPHLAPVIRSILPRSVRLLDPAVHVIQAAAQELELLGLRNTRAALPTQFYVSGCATTFAQLSVQWLGCVPSVEQVNITDLSQVVR